MKAITCSQCGALIEDVSINKKFTRCEYCGAKFRLQPEKVFEIPRQEAKTINASFRKIHQPEPFNKKVLLIFAAVILLTTVIPLIIVFGAVLGVAFFNSDERTDSPTIKEKFERNKKVSVDKKGNVIDAKAKNGHKYIKRISEEAALKTTFYPPVNSDITLDISIFC